ncbi:YcbK family protein [Hyphomicrobium sp. MC8b]|uniref:YcbK family protein n=1 Tax=Hyphomicrobium sp. MC8b TaxID=300273 RepID=UPI00391D8B54
MRKGTIAALSLVLAATTSGVADARPDSDDGDHYRDRAMTSRKIARGSGTSTACLTSEARNLLARIRGQFGNVQIVSTCRPGARIAATGRPSRHASGQAIDFRVPGRKAEVVRWLIANHRNGGVMTYRDMDHIHVDVGPRFVALNAASGRS